MEMFATQVLEPRLNSYRTNLFEIQFIQICLGPNELSANTFAVNRFAGNGNGTKESDIAEMWRCRDVGVGVWMWR